MYLGDNFIVGGISRAGRRVPAGRPDAQILLTQVPDPRQFGVAELDDRRRGDRAWRRSPGSPRATWRWSASTSSRPAVHEAVRQLEAVVAGRAGDHRGHPVADRQRPQGRSTMITGYWKDTGNVADMLEVNRMVLESVEPRMRRHGRRGERAHRPGRRSRTAPRSAARRIVGPVIIGAGTRVSGLLRRPVHLGRRGLRDRRQRDRVLHRAARRVDPGGPADRGVAHRPRRRGDPGAEVPRAHRLVLGDHSKVQISS